MKSLILIFTLVALQTLAGCAKHDATSPQYHDYFHDNTPMPAPNPPPAASHAAASSGAAMISPITPW